MIIDRTWNKYEQKLTISYIDKNGNRAFWNKYLHHIKTYEYDDNGKLDTWDGKKCNEIFKDAKSYSPNEFDILELLYEMKKTDPEMLENFHAQRFPKCYAWDIETEISDEFPYPDKAEMKVTSISLVGPDMSCIVYGLHNMSQDKINRFKERYEEWVENNEFARHLKNPNKPFKVLYQYFETEKEMLAHFFKSILPKIGVLIGWNVYGFDWQYMTNRLKKLFGDAEARTMIKNASPVKEIEYLKYVEMDGSEVRMPAPKHCAILDYMELVKKYDYILRPYESYSLDWVSERAVKGNKIKYEGTLQQLYERDYEMYYFYNAVDSLLVLLIHYRLKCLQSPAALSSVTLVPLLKSLGQVALTTANVFYEFYLDGKHVVYKRGDLPNKEPYEGAFCGCVPGHYTFCVCDDFASLYPSQIRTCNLSFENYVRNFVGPDSFGRYTEIPWSENELEELRKDPNYFVTVMGHVYKNDRDYAFKRMQERFMKMRAKYKYTGQKVDAELLPYIDKLIEEKSK